MNEMSNAAEPNSHFLQFNLLAGLTWTNTVSVIYLSNVRGLSLPFLNCVLIFRFFKKSFIYVLEREERREKERERNINVWLPLTCPLLLGTWPATGNRIGHPLVSRLVLNPLSCTSQDSPFFRWEKNCLSFFPKWLDFSQHSSHVGCDK